MWTRKQAAQDDAVKEARVAELRLKRARHILKDVMPDGEIDALLEPAEKSLKELCESLKELVEAGDVDG